MAISVLTPIYKDENSTESNNRIEELISNYELENEGINERLADLTINSAERRAKTDEEISPIEHAQIAVLRERQNALEDFIADLKSIIYSGYTETPLDKCTSQKHNRTYRKKEELPLFLGKYVKPLILEKEMVTQYEIADELQVPTSTLSYWVNKAYNMDWKPYVANVLNGIF